MRMVEENKRRKDRSGDKAKQSEEQNREAHFLQNFSKCTFGADFPNATGAETMIGAEFDFLVSKETVRDSNNRNGAEERCNDSAAAGVDRRPMQFRAQTTTTPATGVACAVRDGTRELSFHLRRVLIEHLPKVGSGIPAV